MAAEADMTIAHIGKEAEDRGATDKIKDFGKTLVQDHTSDYESLTALASKTGDAIPKGIDRGDYRTVASMDHYKGKMFDHAFLASESAEHQKLIHAFKEEATHGSNPAIKAYATKALPTIEKHLHDAQDLLKQSI
jgi:putative membrane protein